MARVVFFLQGWCESMIIQKKGIRKNGIYIFWSLKVKRILSKIQLYILDKPQLSTLKTSYGIYYDISLILSWYNVLI